MRSVYHAGFSGLGALDHGTESPSAGMQFSLSYQAFGVADKIRTPQKN